MNARATEDLIEVIQLAGREWLFYHAPTPNIALIRGTTADEDGYVSMEHEGTTREDLSIAQAVHNAGGIVICQVKRLARRGSLHPQMVQIPGFLIDYFVHDPDQWQTFGTQFDPRVCGEMPGSVSTIVPDPLTARRTIARRAAFEMRPGDVITSVNRQNVKNMADLQKLAGANQQQLLLHVRRGRGALFLLIE